MSDTVYPLAGVRVIDMTHMLAGPYCTWLLGALGAEVIKVELPGRGDFTRGIAPFLEGKSIYFLSVNRNKRSIAIDLKHPEGREILIRLTGTADVLVENNRPGVMKRLRIDYDSLAAINQRLVYASISGFGQTGPYSARPAFDAVIQAMSGLMSVTGEEGGPPVRVGASVGDISSALFGAVGILAALQQRHRTGRGAYVDIAMLDAQVAVLENAVARFLNAGDVPRRIGSRHPLIAPFQAFPTKDEPIVVCVDTEDQWERLCRVLDRPNLLSEPMFKDGNTRVANHAALEPILEEVFRTRGRAEWLALLEAASVPAGPINSIPDVVDDPQIAARKMVANVGGGSFAAQPIRMASHENWPENPAPALGQHTDEVLAEVGYDANEISRLRSLGVVA
jgi:CoA:oxalate CoA-transferase